jgi:Fur family ferric uptake transcriptional regulator
MAKVLDETLRAAGFRLTAPRRAVLSLLQRSGGQHLSAEDIHAALGRRGLRVDLVSVYRTLNLLVRLGVVHEASLRQTHAHYEIEHGAEVHLACVSCGKVTEARLPTRGRAAEYLARVARRRGFRLTRFGIEVEGYCAACSALRNGKRRVKSARAAR